MQIRGLTTGPEPVAGHAAPPSEEALALVGEVAARHRLRAGAGAPFTGERGWQCYRSPGTSLCAAIIGGALQVHYLETTFSLTSEGRALLRDLEDALEAAFGPDSVRPCKWERSPEYGRPGSDRTAIRHVCVPLARAAGP